LSSISRARRIFGAHIRVNFHRLAGAQIRLAPDQTKFGKIPDGSAPEFIFAAFRWRQSVKEIGGSLRIDHKFGFPTVVENHFGRVFIL
jgi:hypothetical protein